ncbi:hypothetical protein DFH27DRAFT_605773 [Peziza echinospora]|nr:hypothetical protein DFH27DRAFT_605773 [Peziza echinospora]
MTPQPPVTPSPFRFIAPKRQTPGQQQSASRNGARISTPLQWRVRGQSPSGSRGRDEDQDIEGMGEDLGPTTMRKTNQKGPVDLQNDGHEDDRSDEGFSDPKKRDPTTPAPKGRGFAPIRKFHLPSTSAPIKSTIGTPTPSRTINPRSFLISSTPTPTPQNKEIEIEEDEDEDEHENFKEPTSTSKVDIPQKHPDQESQDGVEDPESPVKKRRKVGDAEDALNELANEDAIEDLGSGSDDDEASADEELLVLDFIRRRNETISNVPADIEAHNDDIITTVPENESWDPMDIDRTTHDSPPDLGRGKSPELELPSSPILEKSHSRNLFNTSTPIPKPPNDFMLPPSSTPSASSRKPPKFKLSTPVTNNIPSQPQAHPPSFRLQSTPAPAAPVEPELVSHPTATTSTTKPTKPASSYFRTILAPAHQQQQYPPLSPHRNRHSIIPSDWSPSARRSKRRTKDTSGKYVPNGLAETVLNWTLETLSTGNRGEIFTNNNQRTKNSASYMDRKCLRITQVGEISGRSAQEECIVVRGIDRIIRGDPGVNGEEKSFLLVVGKRGAMIGVLDGLEVGKEITYGMPWWDINLAPPISISPEKPGGDVPVVGGEDGVEEVYRVLVTWEVS